MDTRPIRVLIVEDNPADAELVELRLLEGGYVPSMLRVETAKAMHAALDGDDWDLVLSDFTLPRFSGVQALELLKATGKDIPFILISGSADEDAALAAMRAGAQDFFSKGSLGLLVPAIQRELREAEHRARARAQREQLYQNEKLAALGTLLAGVAHELNNPLSAIMHQATLLQRALSDDPRKTRADQILQAVTTCSGIIRNFLALARQEPPRRVPVSVNDAVQAAIDLVAYGLRIDNIQVTLDLFAPLPTVSGDPQQLERVIINLVTNAQHALRSRTTPGKLIIRSRVDNEAGRVELQVTDNAGGIPVEIRSRIFDPFFTTKPTGQGTGLGLSLCHGIVTAHEGSITVNSEIDMGTTFTISLPIGAATSAAPDHDRAVDDAAPMRGLRILVIDDEPYLASAFSDILTEQGHHVKVAGSGRIALQLIEKGQFDLIVTDMRMPDLDGPMLYREVASRHPRLERSFVFVTGDMFSPDTDRFLKETGAVYLSKPCTFEDVQGAVEQVRRNCAHQPAVG